MYVKVVMQRGHTLDLQVNCILRNIYPDVVSIDSDPYIVLFRGLTAACDR